MRGIEPNKDVTSFSPHPSCLRDALAIHLPPRGERLNRLRTLCHFDRSGEIPYKRNGTTRIRASQMPAAARRREIPCGRNGTTRIRASQMPAAARRREIPCGRNDNKRTRLSRILARRGSLPRQPTRPQGLPARAVFRIITKIT